MTGCTAVDAGSAEAGTGRRERLARFCQRSGAFPLLKGLRAAWRDDIRILAYHRVLESARPEGFTFDLELVSASADDFRAQMQVVRRDFQPMRFDEAISLVDSGRALPRNAVLITFDDGYDDNYHVAYPILRELGMSAMFFVSTGHIDSGLPFSYDWLVHMLCSTPRQALTMPALGDTFALGEGIEQRRTTAAWLLDRMKILGAREQAAAIAALATELEMPGNTPHADCRPMTWDQLRTMHGNGMEIGAHGVGHHMLGKLSQAQSLEEVAASKATIERELGAPVTVMSYPVGGEDSFSAAILAQVEDAGYRLACTYITGTDRITPDSRFRMRRLPVEVMDTSWFEAMLAAPEIFTFPLRQRVG